MGTRLSEAIGEGLAACVLTTLILIPISLTVGLPLIILVWLALQFGSPTLHGELMQTIFNYYLCLMAVTFCIQFLRYYRRFRAANDGVIEDAPTKTTARAGSGRG